MQVRNQAIENINYDLKLIKLLGKRLDAQDLGELPEDQLQKGR